MNVERIEAIERIPLAIDYRRLFRANAVLTVAERETAPTPIEFSLELSPFGSQEVSVRFLEVTAYPILPALKLLKEHIAGLDRNGTLP